MTLSFSSISITTVILLPIKWAGFSSVLEQKQNQINYFSSPPNLCKQRQSGEGRCWELCLYTALKWPGAEWCCTEHIAHKGWADRALRKLISPKHLGLPRLQSKTSEDNFYRYGRPSCKIVNAQGTQCRYSKSLCLWATVTVSSAAREFLFKSNTGFSPIFERNVGMQALLNIRKRKCPFQVRCGRKKTFLEIDGTWSFKFLPRLWQDPSLSIFWWKWVVFFFRSKVFVSNLKKISIYSHSSIWTSCSSSKSWFPDRIWIAFREEEIVAPENTLQNLLQVFVLPGSHTFFSCILCHSFLSLAGHTRNSSYQQSKAMVKNSCTPADQAVILPFPTLFSFSPHFSHLY